MRVKIFIRTILYYIYVQINDSHSGRIKFGRHLNLILELVIEISIMQRASIRKSLLYAKVFSILNYPILLSNETL